MGIETPIEELHFDDAPHVETAIPGPTSKRLLERQEALDTNAVAYPKDVPIALGEAKGATIRDADGNTFLDFFAGIGVLNVGHSNPYVLEAVTDQMGELVHSIDFPTEARIDLLEKLDEIAPPGLRGRNKVIFGGPTGSDAIEGAIKLAKHNTGRSALLAFEGAYHGTTAGALSLTAGKAFKEGYTPVLADAMHVPYPNPVRDALDGPASVDRTLELVQRKFEDPYGGTESPAAIFVEPIQGEGGVVVPPEGLLSGLRDIADDNDAMLIFDEIQAGFGRTGEWWGADHYGVTPDAMTMAKAIGGIGLPLGAMMYHEAFDTWDAGGHVGTFRGNAPAMVGGVRAAEYIQEHDLLDHATDLGEYIRGRLREADHPTLAEVRGKGLFVGAAFLTDDGTGDKEAVKAIRTQCYQQGVLTWKAGRNGNVLRLLPPLVMTREQAKEGLDIIVDAIEAQAEQVATADD
jgi:diaminobutyrate-2-oxoglutarate transaminase